MNGAKRQKREPRVDDKGREINPYIPKFISDTPWYRDSTEDDRANPEDYLSHQRQDPSKPIEKHSEPKPGAGIVDKVASEVETQVPSGYKRVAVFPANACTNCGSLNHLRRECLEKPRKVDAKSLLVVKEEHKARLKNVSDWDSKRDRWNGYDAEKDWDDQVKVWKRKEESLGAAAAGSAADADADDEDADLDEDEAAELAELGLGVQAKKPPVVAEVRNPADRADRLPVRSREDRPVYLRNLGGEITYNPKSRTDRSADAGYLNDHNQFVRHLNGEAQEYERLKKFAWDANKDYQIGAAAADANGDEEPQNLEHLNKHIEASPTAAALEAKQRQEKRDKERDLKRQALLAKYGESVTNGGGDAFKTKSVDSAPPPVQKDPAEQARAYDFSNIYDPKVKSMSRYKEDVYPKNHKSVWGSFWEDGKWGYACCKKMDRESECNQ